MLATVVWLGSLAGLALLVLPAMRRTLKEPEYALWLDKVNRRLDPLGWLCLTVLIFTGLVQMEANPSYAGLLNISNSWAVAICAKHVVFFGMLGVSAYLTWSLAPALRRAALKRASGSNATADQGVLSRFQLMVTLNLALGVLVLIFTALARIS